MRRTAGAHIVFGVNLEEAVLPAFGQDGRQMFMLEARACKARYRIGRKAETASAACESVNLVTAFILSPPSGRSLTLTRVDRASQRRERARVAAWHLYAGASAMLHELPGVALEVDGRGALTRRSRPRRTVVLTLQRDAEAFFLVGRDGGLLFRLG